MMKLPADPAHPSHGGFTTIPLFASGQLDNAAALARALKEFLAFCDEHGLNAPVLGRPVAASFPCWLVVAIREHLTKRVQVGRLRIQHEDGGCSFGLHWKIAAAGAPVRTEPPSQPATLNRRIRISRLTHSSAEAPRFMVTALHPEIGGGGEFFLGTEPGETGFTEARLRDFLAAAYGMSDAEVTRAVQAAQAQASAPLHSSMSHGQGCTDTPAP